MFASAVALGVLVVRAWGRGAVLSAWPSVVASVVALVFAWPVSRVILDVLPAGGTIASTLALGVLAGVAGVVVQLALVALGHRESLRALDPRRLRAGEAP